jgi:hypothetical protein
LERKVGKEEQVMAEEKVSSGSPETDQPAKATEYYDATRQVAGEYYETARETAGEYIESTRALADKLYDSVKAGEVAAASRERPDSISAAIEAGKRAYFEESRRSTLSRILDATGNPLENNLEWDTGIRGLSMPEEFVRLTISQGEFDRLSSKTREILTEAALAQERIAKDQEEIDLLKTETRETLRRLRAA